jgi:ankyrin repeat protein
LTDHLSKFNNKLTPIPGSQVATEQNHATDREKYHQDLDAMVKQKADDLESKLAIKLKSTEFKTKVFFDTVIGLPMLEAEKVLNEKEEILNTKFIQLDDIRLINKFITNIELNRSHYVSYAITCGFRSINYQVPTSGNTAMHIAVRKGHCETVEELLKFKADPDIKNSIGALCRLILSSTHINSPHIFFFTGNHPIHECWLFWKTNANRTKEERIEQEQKTCKILLSILSYGGFVDSQDIKGQSALHIACRLGSVQAVKIILSFKADYLLCLNNGKTCQDIALEYGNEEVYKLLNSWQLIRKHVVHLDFHTVWHKFLADYEAVINSHKNAETIIAGGW